MNITDRRKILFLCEAVLELTAIVSAITGLMIERKVCTNDEIEDVKKAILESEPMASAVESIKRQQAEEGAGDNA